MNQEQFDRWKDFSMRMASVAIRGGRWQKELREHLTECFGMFECETIKSWDHSGGRQLPVCDKVSDYLWENQLQREKEYRNGNIEIIEGKMVVAIQCCLRAGLDVAVEPSAGVCGFTAGDIRRMYPEGVPDWIKAFFAPPAESVSLHQTNIEGIFHQESYGVDSRTFDDLPDDQGVWL